MTSPYFLSRKSKRQERIDRFWRAWFAVFTFERTMILLGMVIVVGVFAIAVEVTR